MPKGRGFLCFVRLFLGKASIKNSDLRIPFAILLSFSLLISDFSLWIPKATEAVSVVFDKGEENAGEKPKLTLPFVENIGQFANKDLKFYVNTQKATVSVTEDGISYAVRPGNERSESKEGLDKLQSAYFSESFVASDGEIIKAVPYGAGSSGAVISAFLGNDKTKWKSKIPNYQEVKFDQVWDKVNVSLSASRSSVEKIFEIEPGGNPSDISMSIDGSFQLRDGKLFISTPAGEAYMTEPKAFQLSEDGTKSFVDAVYDLRAGSIYGFAVFDYDRSKTLIIDPLLGSTFLEGASNLIDYAAISVAADGSIFVAGETRDPNFDVTPGVWDSTFNGGLSSGDFVIAKFNSSLTQLLALTYLGGTSDETSWNSTIAFDAAGNVFISGDSSSADYPVVTGAYDESYNGSSDLVISKLSSDLTQLLGSTFVGSTGNEDAGGVAVDGLGNVYSVTSVASGAGCNTFPKTTGAAFETCDLATTNSGVVKLNNDLTTFLAGTYMHGEEATAIALDSTGNIFITGVVTSNLLYTTALAFDKTFGGYYDVGVTKINSDMTSILASTYLGGNHYENPAKWSQNALAIDSNDNVFVGGETQSTDFPTTVGAYDRTYSDYKDSFLTKFDNTLTNVLASTYLGGDGTEEGAAIAIDSSDNVYFTAYTDSSSFFGDVFSTTAGTYQENEPGNANDGDPFVSKFNNDLTSLLASTYLGGPGSYTSYYQAIALDATNNVYVAGPVEDPNFPTTAGAYDRTLGSSNGFFISKLDSGLTGYAMNHLEAEAISDVESDGFETGFDSAFWDDAYSPSPYGADSVSSVFYLPSGKILIAGSFTTYNKTAVSRVARLNADGSLDAAFVPPTINNTVNSLGVQSDGKIVIAGAFTTVGASSRNRIARLNADGSFDASFDPGTGAGSSVYELAIQSDDKVVVAGSFTAYGGTTINNLVRLNSNGSLDGGFNAGGTGAGSYVNDLLVQGDGKIVIGGAFITYNGTGRSRVARINADGTLDGTFDPGTGASSTVETVGIQSDGKIMIGGRFSSYDGTGRNYIARINADGTLDNTFNPGTGASSYVYDLLVLPGDKTLISGGFATYNGTARPNYAKINTDGTLDGSFTPAVPNLYSNALTIQTDNKLLLGGFFTVSRGTYSYGGIARLESSGSEDNAFNVIAEAQFGWNTDTSQHHSGSAALYSSGSQGSSNPYFSTTVVFPAAGQISFYWKSNLNSDSSAYYGSFCMDLAAGSCDSMNAGYAGRIAKTTDWTRVTVPVTAGSHYFEWFYTGDAAGGGIWVDDVRFSTLSNSDSATSGQAKEVQITAVNTNGDASKAYSGDSNIVFSGLSGAAASDKNGTAVPFGTPATLTFADGIALTNITPSTAETASMDATDGSYDTSSDSGYDLDLVVAPAGAATVTVGGTVFGADESTPVNSSPSLKLVSSGISYTTSAAVNGTFTFANVAEPNPGDVITIWLNTGGTLNGSLVFLYGSLCAGYPNCTGLEVFSGKVSIDSKSVGRAVTNSLLANCDNDSGAGCADTDIGFTSEGTNLNLTWTENQLRVSGDFFPQGDVTAKKVHVAGEYRGSRESLKVTGAGSSATCSDLDASMPLCVTGTFTAPLTTKFNGPSTTVPALTFKDLEFGTDADFEAATYTLAGDITADQITVGNSLSTNDDTLAAGSRVITINGSGNGVVVSGHGIFSPGTSTVIYGGASNVSSIGYNNLEVGNSGSFSVQNIQIGGEEDFDAAVADEENGYAYVGTGAGNLSYLTISKLDLKTFTNVGTIYLPFDDYDSLKTAVIDKTNHFAYFGTLNGRVVKIDLSDFSYEGFIQLAAGERYLEGGVIDEANGFAYFAARTASSGLATQYIVKVNVSPANFSRVSAITLAANERLIQAGAIDNTNHFAYFGNNLGAATAATVIKIDVTPGNFAHVSNLALNAGEGGIFTAVLDPANDFGYFGAGAFVVKVRLSTMARIGAVAALATVSSGHADLANHMAYFGTKGASQKVFKVDIDPANFASVGSLNLAEEAQDGFIDADRGYLYFSLAEWPGVIAKIQLSDFTVSDSLSFLDSPGYLATGVVDKINGFAYFINYGFSDMLFKYDLKKHEYIGWIPLLESQLTAAVIDEVNGFAYFATGGAGLSTIVKVNIDPDNFSLVGSITLTQGYNVKTAVLDPVNLYAYFGTDTGPGMIVKVDVDPARTFGEIQTLTMADAAEGYFATSGIDSASGFAYFGIWDSPAGIVKINVSPANFSRAAGIIFNAGENYATSSLIDAVNGYAYFGLDTIPGRIVKVRLSDLGRVGVLDLNAGENQLEAAAMDSIGHYGYFGTYDDPGQIIRVDLWSMSRVDAVTPPLGYYYYYAVTGSGKAYFFPTYAGEITELTFADGQALGTAAGQTITVNSDLTINYAASGKNYNPNINVAGDLIVQPAANFKSTSGTVQIGGNLTSSGQFSSEGGTISFAGTGTSTVTGVTDFSSLQMTVPGKSLQFATAGSPIYTFSGTLDVVGAPLNHVSISSDTSGVQWIGNFASDQTARYVTVTDSGCDAGTSSVTASDSTNGLNNGACWVFVAGPANASPNPPSGFGPASLTNGSSTTDTTPTFTFAVDDPDAGNSVKYRIQIDDNADFSSPVVDYTSALAANPYSASFTVGQAQEATGTYASGSGGQSLSNGSYFWRVRAIDDSDAFSAFVAANGGAVAFVVDSAVQPSGSGGGFLPQPEPNPSQPDAIASGDPVWVPDYQNAPELVSQSGQDRCLAFNGKPGWYAQFFDYPKGHKDMELPSSQWNKSYGDPLSSQEQWKGDWFNQGYFRFAKNVPNLAFGKKYFPFDYESQEFTSGHDYYFGARYTSRVSAKPGFYTYRISSDDDSWVYVDGKLIVDNRGIHGATTRTGSVYLSGKNLVEVFFAERHTTESHLYFGFDDQTGNLEYEAYSEDCKNQIQPPQETSPESNPETPKPPKDSVIPPSENPKTETNNESANESGNGGKKENQDDKPAVEHDNEEPNCISKTGEKLKDEINWIKESYRATVKAITKQFVASVREARALRSSAYKNAENLNGKAKSAAKQQANDEYHAAFERAKAVRKAALAKAKADKQKSFDLLECKGQIEPEQSGEDNDEGKTEEGNETPGPEVPPIETGNEDQGSQNPPPPSNENQGQDQQPGGDSTGSVPTEPETGGGIVPAVLGVLDSAGETLADFWTFTESEISNVIYSLPPDVQDFAAAPFSASSRIAEALPGGQPALDVVSNVGTIIIPTITTTRAVATTTSAVGFSEILLLATQAMREVLVVLGLRKKRTYWGVVYDSLSKQPLDPVIVKLIETKNSQVLETAITDLYGRYGFLSPTGEFRLEAAKTGYRFPSSRVTGSSDEIYNNLYRGESLAIRGAEVFAPNIPLDPYSFDWNQQAKKAIIKFHPRWEWFIGKLLSVLFWFGFALGVFAWLAHPGILNTSLLLFYVAIILFRFFLPRKRLWGRIVGSAAKPEEITLEVMYPNIEGIVLATVRVSPTGKFFLKVKPGDYRLTIKRAGNILDKLEVSVGKEGVVNQDIRLKK